jgi:hypothetical protein
MAPREGWEEKLKANQPEIQPTTLIDEDLTDDPFAAFSEWYGESDRQAYADVAEYMSGGDPKLARALREYFENCSD